MNNSRISAKERGLLKGAIRRVFSRSDLRRAVVALTIVEHHDPLRPRVKKWSKCQSCQELIPTYLLEVDHISPVIPLDTTLEQMDWNTLVDRVFCERNNLWCLCDPCHTLKTRDERKARTAHKRKRVVK